MRPGRTTLVAAALLCRATLFGQGMGSAAKAVARPAPGVKPARPPAIDYVDVASAWGVTARNVYGGEAKKRYILEMTGNGVAILDADNDGWPDLFFPNGARLDSPGPPGRLYRNNEGRGFIDISARSGLTRTGWGQGACAGDYDGDGLTDLLVTYYGASNALYRNLGGGSFRAETGLPAGPVRWPTGCAFLDYDRDGDLDLFVSNYVVFDLAQAAAPGASPFCLWKGVPVFCGPRGFPTGANQLLRNEGNGRFRDVSKETGILLAGPHYGLGVTVSDFDGDGWPDIYVACDSTPSILYANRRNGTFEDVAVPGGTAYGEAGQEQGSMGVAAGDYDNDGRIDIVKTNFMDETPALHRNEGEFFFSDTTYAAGLGAHTKFVGWGVAFLDADQDGRRDILMAHGHIYPEMDASKSGETFRQPKLLYWNADGGRFADVTSVAGAALTTLQSSRGLATADLDGDGTLEAVIVNMNAAPTILKNRAAAVGNAILLDLGGRIGAMARVEAGGAAQVDEVRSGSSYASQSDHALHFGLGQAREARVTVRWPGKAKDEDVGPLAAGYRYTIREGEGLKTKRAFRVSRLP